VDVVK
jgi:hypothetical protein